MQKKEILNRECRLIFMILFRKGYLTFFRFPQLLIDWNLEFVKLRLGKVSELDAKYVKIQFKGLPNHLFSNSSCFNCFFQGTHICNCAGVYILQWKYSSPASSSRGPPKHLHRAKFLYYYEVLPSKDFR